MFAAEVLSFAMTATVVPRDERHSMMGPGRGSIAVMAAKTLPSVKAAVPVQTAKPLAIWPLTIAGSPSAIVGSGQCLVVAVSAAAIIPIAAAQAGTTGAKSYEQSHRCRTQA